MSARSLLQYGQSQLKRRQQMTVAMTVRQPSLPWSREDVIRTWPRAVSGTMPRRLRGGAARHRQSPHGSESAAARGAALYARRKVIVAPVFGQIKEARGFRRRLLRGLQKIRGAWRLGV